MAHLLLVLEGAVAPGVGGARVTTGGQRNRFKHKQISLVLDHLLGGGSLAETVLEAAGEGLEVAHAASALSSSALRLGGPVVAAHLGGGVAARRALLLLDVERAHTAATAQSVRLVVAGTLRAGTLRLQSKRI